MSNSIRDTSELPLSSSQLEIFEGWKRPEKVFPQPTVEVKTQDVELGLTMIPHAKVDLVQDITTDCSVVASLCAIMSRAEGGHAKVWQ